MGRASRRKVLKRKDQRQYYWQIIDEKMFVASNIETAILHAVSHKPPVMVTYPLGLGNRWVCSVYVTDDVRVQEANRKFYKQIEVQVDIMDRERMSAWRWIFPVINLHYVKDKESFAKSATAIILEDLQELRDLKTHNT